AHFGIKNVSSKSEMVEQKAPDYLRWNNPLYKGNKIQTTKYSILSFLPKNLFEQLHRFANVYFIFLAALNFVPVVEAFQPEISVIPIILVLSVTAVKDIWEDYFDFRIHLENGPCVIQFSR
uniref:P-type ATPase N-terminal domain-containing protein n=1 Tax=Stegastes partitus TaxID=144197 RepID=A0A3B5BLK6_9TELE